MLSTTPEYCSTILSAIDRCTTPPYHHTIIRAVKIASKYSCPHRIFGCPHTKKECWLPGNIIKCLAYFVVPMNAAVHVMCFYYSSWNDKIYANIKISKVGKTWLSACTPVYSFSVVRTADTGGTGYGTDTRFLQPWLCMLATTPLHYLII